MEACGPQGLKCIPSPLQKTFTQPCTDPPTSKGKKQREKERDCSRSKILKRPNKQGRVLLGLESGKLEDVWGEVRVSGHGQALHLLPKWTCTWLGPPAAAQAPCIPGSEWAAAARAAHGKGEGVSPCTQVGRLVGLGSAAHLGHLLRVP